MTKFMAVENSTIYDVCLNTYGSLDFLIKLMVDNDFAGVETRPKAGQEFIFDESLVVNQQVYNTNFNKNIKYATG
jgi:hypothetical protein